MRRHNVFIVLLETIDRLITKRNVILKRSNHVAIFATLIVAFQMLGATHLVDAAEDNVGTQLKLPSTDKLKIMTGFKSYSDPSGNSMQYPQDWVLKKLVVLDHKVDLQITNRISSEQIHYSEFNASYTNAIDAIKAYANSEGSPYKVVKPASCDKYTIGGVKACDMIVSLCENCKTPMKELIVVSISPNVPSTGQDVSYNGPSCWHFQYEAPSSKFTQGLPVAEQIIKTIVPSQEFNS